jgi:DNA-binding response OmpR family regulator
MDKRILIIEDDPHIADLVRLHLKDEGFHLECAADGETGLGMAGADSYALVILDLMLPGIDGLSVCRQIRREHRGLPILMLTAKSEEIDKVVGLEMGADDYLTKPFSVRELVARVKAILRRSGGVADGNGARREEMIRLGPLCIDHQRRRVTLAGDAVGLTNREFDLLALFAAHPGRAYNREQLLNQVWGYSFGGYEHTVNTHINRLRQKIESDPSNPRYIHTVWGYGYRFADVEELSA